MSDTTAQIDMALTRQRSSEASVGDYIALLKPRVMSLVVFTALVGIVAAPSAINPVIGLTALICIAVGAGASGALNMWYDADIDAKMQRTKGRPVPMGRIDPGIVAGLELYFINRLLYFCLWCADFPREHDLFHDPKREGRRQSLG